MTFSTLALVIVLGLLGPLLAWRQSWHIPVIVGELGAGVVFGVTGLRVLHPGDHVFTFLADIGFAVVMFIAGTHVPVRDPQVRAALGRGAVRAAAVGVFAAVIGYGLAAAFETGHAGVYAVLMASSSAAVVLPIIDGVGLTGDNVLATTAQVAIADTVCIVALPLVVDARHAAAAALGAVAVAGCAAVLFAAMRWAERSGLRRRVHQVSEDRKFAIELRVSLVGLFALAALATAAGVSVMLAGFALGLAVAGVGEPRRVAHQLFAIGEGFLAPLFFVWLGARIDLREFGAHPRSIVLGLALGGGAIAVHAAMRLLGQPLSLGALAAAQIGVPVAAVTVGQQLHVLVPGEAAAIVLGALITIAGAAAAAGIAARARASAPASAEAR
ncbi:cation:proton antiporter [Tsukamurella sp. 8F]|uniref:cation:proton antiporter n=1 Tax=unclassified Tsukamurella TaxID=2633480 RepID=UPI0023B9BE9F|nr:MULTISPECIES: cation:proton antiporter [unclassified Tsukamurella]MDF0531322.1 cation:proton antiporter [Tsukamurella sp. 8J]MDF0588528.1 cation:proton antiporter [Tsukamurella sp. 8F]